MATYRSLHARTHITQLLGIAVLLYTALVCRTLGMCVCVSEFLLVTVRYGRSLKEGLPAVTKRDSSLQSEQLLCAVKSTSACSGSNIHEEPTISRMTGCYRTVVTCSRLTVYRHCPFIDGWERNWEYHKTYGKPEPYLCVGLYDIVWT